MNREEFIKYAKEVLSYESLEPLFDSISEHNGEVARYGDSGPGSLLWIQKAIREVTSIERQLARLEGRDQRKFNFGVRAPR